MNKPMREPTDKYKDEQLSIDNEISQLWCQMIEGIVQDTVQKVLRSMRVEQYAEVIITGANVSSNTVDCRNIQTGEMLVGVPNYSNFNFFEHLDESGNVIGAKGARGRIFITDVSDNPCYLGVWYN